MPIPAGSNGARVIWEKTVYMRQHHDLSVNVRVTLDARIGAAVSTFAA
jgi:hypothetical protein